MVVEQHAGSSHHLAAEPGLSRYMCRIGGFSKSTAVAGLAGPDLDGTVVCFGIDYCVPDVEHGESPTNGTPEEAERP